MTDPKSAKCFFSGIDEDRDLQLIENPAFKISAQCRKQARTWNVTVGIELKEKPAELAQDSQFAMLCAKLYIPLCFKISCDHGASHSDRVGEVFRYENVEIFQGLFATGIAAVLLPTITMPANPENRTATARAAKSLTQNNFSCRCHPRPKARLDNSR